ncbi:MAG: tripartite tricarboxylate transporter TctB family protein [Alphaproteobacteria bacterium]|nr:tripartite tricarboxylate transporter TctB family protein [Alphaproteobacteria bacterium]
MRRDLILGLAVFALAAAYYAAADALPRSMLSDGVGADGAPKLYALMLGLLGVVQIARSIPRAGRSGGAREPVPMGEHLRALGVLAIGAVYIVVTPYLGYLPATALLIYVVTVYAGQAHSWRTAVISLGGGAVLWVSFAKLLGVPMPAGLLGRLVG